MKTIGRGQGGVKGAVLDLLTYIKGQNKAKANCNSQKRRYVCEEVMRPIVT